MATLEYRAMMETTMNYDDTDELPDLEDPELVPLYRQTVQNCELEGSFDNFEDTCRKSCPDEQRQVLMQALLKK